MSTRRTRMLIAVAAALPLGLVACTSDDAAEDTTTTTTTTTEPPDTTSTTTEPPDTTTTTEPPETTTTEEPDGPDLIGAPTTETVESPDFPGLSGDTAELVDVRVARQDGFTRVVLEFDGADVPSHRIGYIDPPARQPGSGAPIDIDGFHLLELRMTPATTVDLTGPEFVETYTGPDVVELPSGGPGNEVVFAGDFEANLAWVIGLDAAVPFATAFLEDPLRLVVDVTDG